MFYTLRGAGLIEQDGNHSRSAPDKHCCSTAAPRKAYCTAPHQSCWHHYWVHLDGTGAAAMEPLLFPVKKLTPVQITGVKHRNFLKQFWRRWSVALWTA